MKNSNTNKALIEVYLRGYRVSEDGRVHNNGKEIKTVQIADTGYRKLSVRVAWSKHPVKVSVHRLLAYQLYGDKMFVEGIVCRHLNCDKLDNSHSNIAIGTLSENSLDNPKEQRLSRAINAASKLRRFTDEQIAEIKKDHENGLSYSKLCEKYGACKGTLSYIFNEARYNGLVPKPQKQIRL